MTGLGGSAHGLIALMLFGGAAGRAWTHTPTLTERNVSTRGRCDVSLTKLPWSYTAWDCALGEHGCPLKYKLRYLDRLKPMGPPPAHLVKGRNAHSAMDGCMHGSPIPALAHPKTHVLIDAIRGCDDKLIEYKLTVNREWQMGGLKPWLVVVCDVVRQDDAMTVVTIDDWKTGKTRAPAYSEQMSLYRTVAAGVWPADAYVVNLVNLDDGKITTSTTTRAEALAEREKWVDRATELETLSDFSPRPNQFCGNCDFAASNGGPCRFG